MRGAPRYAVTTAGSPITAAGALRRSRRRDPARRCGQRARSQHASRARRARSSRLGRGCARISSTALSISAGLRPDSTSSSSTSCGREASARASSRNLRWCRLSSSGSASAFAASRANSSQRVASRSARSARQRGAAEHRRERDVVAARSGARNGPRDLIGAGDAGARDAVRGQCRRSRRPRTGCDPRRLGNGRSPTLMNVDLPEPLGPSSPRISPARTSRSTPSSACTPSNALRQASTTSKRRSLRAAFGRRAGGARPRRCDPTAVAPRLATAAAVPARPRHLPRMPLRHEQDDQISTTPTTRLAGDRVIARGERVQERGDRRRADAGPGPVPRAAEHAHQHDGQRHRDRECLADRHVRDEQRVDAAGDAGERARQRERGELEAVGRHAHHFGDVLVVVDREQAAAEPRAQIAYAIAQRRDRQRERQQIERRRRARRRASAAARR